MAVTRQDHETHTPASALAHWETTLEDALFNLQFPVDKKRPVQPDWATADQPVVLDAATVAGARALATATDATLEDVLLATWAVLVFRYTHSEDFLVGRAAPGMAPLRLRLPDALTFRELLAAVRAGRAMTETHAVDWAALLAHLDITDVDSISPLVQLAFALTEAEAELPHTGKLDLLLHLWADGDALAGRLRYQTALFDAETPARLATHYALLLRGALAAPETPVACLPILTEAERQMMLVQWNDNPKTFDKVVPVYRLFEDWAAQQPEATAAIYLGETITYDALNRRANRLAQVLVARGVGPDVIVALLGTRSIDYLTAILAVHKAGGAFLPLDPKHPAGRVAGVLEQSEARVVLITHEFAEVAADALEAMQAGHPTPVVLQIDTAVASGDDEHNLPQRCTMDSLAYVMFTSGSTGKPKGVMVEHLGMLNHNHAKVDDLNMTHADTLAQNGPQSFDIMVWQFVAPLMIGGVTHIVEDEVAKDPVALLRFVDAHNITVLQLVPILLEAMVQEAARLGDDRPQLAALKWMVPTGDALPTKLCRDWLALYPDIPLMNTYGSTECSDDQCHYPVPHVEPGYRLPIMTVGRPIYNTQVYILDKLLQPVPIGVTGEIYVGGIGVGRGYLNDPERTDKAFGPDPFTTDREGAKLYKMGDQGRFLADGTIEFLGRVDFMVKVRGFRIELGEIEAALSKHEAVKQRVVVVHEDERGGKNLAAYVVFQPGHAATVEDLRAHLRGLLPDYMVPRYFTVMDALPINSNGKVDRKQLPPPDANAERGEVVAPHTPIEEKLVAIWQDVLNVRPIGVTDDFFELGGHSMLAIQIFARIRQTFERDLPLATLFRAPTIQQLARLVDPAADENAFRDLLHAVVVPIQPKGALPPFFCIGGGVLNMRELAQRLGDDQPFYALQWQSLEDEQVMHTSVERAAATFIEGIRSVQPEGPYYLGGSFAAGVIAVEVARQLEAAGDEVALLAGFDSITGKGGIVREAGAVKQVKRTRLQRVVGMLQKGPGYIWDRLLHYDYEEAFQHTLWKAVMAYYERVGKPVPPRFRQGIFEEFFILRANAEHQPQGTYTGPFELYLSTDRYNHMAQFSDWSWGTLVDGPIRVEQVPGDPCTIMLDPNVDKLATHLRQRLEETYREQGVELEAIRA